MLTWQYVDHLFLPPRFPSPCNTDNCCCLIYFSVQASIAANTWVVSGSPQTKSMLSLLSIFEDLYNRQSFLVCLFQCFNRIYNILTQKVQISVGIFFSPEMATLLFIFCESLFFCGNNHNWWPFFASCRLIFIIPELAFLWCWLEGE